MDFLDNITAIQMLFSFSNASVDFARKSRWRFTSAILTINFYLQFVSCLLIKTHALEGQLNVYIHLSKGRMKTVWKSLVKINIDILLVLCSKNDVLSMFWQYLLFTHRNVFSRCHYRYYCIIRGVRNKTGRSIVCKL